jgi:hypothetical protein
MTESTEDTQLWSWSERAIASLFWSEAETAWRWGVTRRKAGKWELWRSGTTATCYSACVRMSDAFADLAQDEGEPF